MKRVCLDFIPSGIVWKVGLQPTLACPRCGSTDLHDFNTERVQCKCGVDIPKQFFNFWIGIAMAKGDRRQGVKFLSKAPYTLGMEEIIEFEKTKVLEAIKKLEHWFEIHPA